MQKYGCATSHPLSTRVGMEVLEQGGNAFDAAIAVSAALTVVQPHLNGLGGDFFAIIDEGKPVALNASGFSASMCSVDFFTKRGFTEIPKRGSLSSFMVPGIVSAWSLLIERCSLRPSELFLPAIKLAEEGFYPSESTVCSASSMQGADRDWSLIYRGISTDRLLVQKSIGKTLSDIAADGGHSFYHGSIAREIESDMVRKGGLLRFDDLDSYSAVLVNPLTVRYRGYDVYTNPPNSQGATELMWLKLLDALDLASMPDIAFYNEIIRTMRIAYYYRARYIGDPGTVIFPQELLDSVPDPSTISSAGMDERQSDTTAFSVYDGHSGISAIQSNYMGFGSGHSIEGRGINMSNRGTYFTLNESHHNSAGPRKQTFHTLMATFARGQSKLYLSSMGGDVQPQSNVQILTGLIDRQRDAQEAVEYPRFAYPASIYGDAEIISEPGLHIDSSKTLSERSAITGAAQLLAVSDEVRTGIDPRGDGLLHYPAGRTH